MGLEEETYWSPEQLRLVIWGQLPQGGKAIGRPGCFFWKRSVAQGVHLYISW